MDRLGKILTSLLLIALGVIALVLMLTAQPAGAQPGVVSQDVGVCDPWFPKNCLAPLGRVSVAGDQYAVSTAAAVAPTIPDGALAVLITAIGTNNAAGQCLLWRMDGTDPTGTVGNPLPANTPMWYSVKTSPTLSAPNPAIKFITATGATCAANFSYFK